MKHDWKMGWKENKIRKGFIDECKRCGVLKVSNLFTNYILSSEANKFISTNKPVEFFNYLPCKDNNGSIGSNHR